MTNSTKIIIGIIIVLAVAGIGYMLFSNTYPAQAPTVDNQQANGNEPSAPGPNTGTLTNTSTSTHDVNGPIVVSYTDNGFSPDSITVKKGDTVNFVNNSSKKMWVASNVHPTHKEYPEAGTCFTTVFAPTCGLASGGTFSFTFNLVGTWRYHNHLSSGDTGTVTVTQ